MEVGDKVEMGQTLDALEHSCNGYGFGWGSTTITRNEGNSDQKIPRNHRLSLNRGNFEELFPRYAHVGIFALPAA